MWCRLAEVIPEVAFDPNVKFGRVVPFALGGQPSASPSVKDMTGTFNPKEPGSRPGRPTTSPFNGRMRVDIRDMCRRVGRPPIPLCAREASLRSTQPARHRRRDRTPADTDADTASASDWLICPR